MQEGRDTLFDIDWQGGQQIRNSALGRDVVSIFILPPSIAELESRLRGRAQDSDSVIADRMAKSRDEISHWAEYDYVIVNADLERSIEGLRANEQRIESLLNQSLMLVTALTPAIGYDRASGIAKHAHKHGLSLITLAAFHGANRARARRRQATTHLRRHGKRRSGRQRRRGFRGRG